MGLGLRSERVEIAIASSVLHSPVRATFYAVPVRLTL